MAYACYGLKAKNEAQKEAIQALLDVNVDLVILSGLAGSGKTLLALASGLQQVVEQNRYSDIIFTRAACGLGADMGFLPGTQEEKMAPYAGGLYDNLDLLVKSKGKMSDITQRGTEVVLKNKIKVQAMQYIRGRSFTHKWVIVDEVQNMSVQELKVLITRIGEGSKIVCLGDAAQIDNKHLNETTNGLTHLIEAYNYTKAPYIKHVQLPDGVRSRLCTWGAQFL